MAKIISVPLADPNSFLNVSVLTWHLSPLTWKIWISGHNRTPSSPTTTTKNTISISNLSYFISFFQRNITSHKFIWNHFLSFLNWTTTQQKKRRKQYNNDIDNSNFHKLFLIFVIPCPSLFLSLCLKSFVSLTNTTQYLNLLFFLLLLVTVQTS